MCGAGARVHVLQFDGLCRRCDRQHRTCIRCKKNVPKAALILQQGVVCPNCRSHFGPALKRSKPKGEYATCSGCHKHRPLAGHSLLKRPLCIRCLAADRSVEVAAKNRAYWLRALDQRAAVLALNFEYAWCQALFKEMAVWCTARSDAAAVVYRLPKYVPTVSRLDSSFSSIQQITSQSLLETFSTAEMRSAEMVFSFLAYKGVKLPSRDETEAHADLRRIAGYLDAARLSPHFDLLKRFSERAQEQVTTAVAARSTRLKLRAAFALIEKAGGKPLEQGVIERFLREKPGLRATLGSFITFLREMGLEVRLPPSRGRARNVVKNDDALLACLLVLDRSTSFPELRAALAGCLVGVLGMPLEHILRLERSELRASPGSVWLRIDGQPIQLEANLADGARRYLQVRDQIALNRGPLFCGRPISQRVHSQSVTRLLRKWGISTTELASKGRSWLKKGAAMP